MRQASEARATRDIAPRLADRGRHHAGGRRRAALPPRSGGQRGSFGAGRCLALADRVGGTRANNSAIPESVYRFSGKITRPRAAFGRLLNQSPTTCLIAVLRCRLKIAELTLFPGAFLPPTTRVCDADFGRRRSPRGWVIGGAEGYECSEQRTPATEGPVVLYRRRDVRGLHLSGRSGRSIGQCPAAGAHTRDGIAPRQYDRHRPGQVSRWSLRSPQVAMPDRSHSPCATAPNSPWRSSRAISRVPGARRLRQRRDRPAGVPAGGRRGRRDHSSGPAVL